MDQKRDEMTRRTFVAGAMVGGFAVVVSCSDDDAMTDAGPQRDTGVADDVAADDTGILDDVATGDVGNSAPIWATVPTVVFTQGVASSFSIAEFVTDPDDDMLTITLNDMPLPEGVAFNATEMSFVYDGVGPLASTSGHVLTADDGRA